MPRMKIHLTKRNKEEMKSYTEGYRKAIEDVRHFMKYYHYDAEEALSECEKRLHLVYEVICMEESEDTE